MGTEQKALEELVSAVMGAFRDPIREVLAREIEKVPMDLWPDTPRECRAFAADILRKGPPEG